MDLVLILRALDPPMVEAWQRAFDGERDVDIAQGDVLEPDGDAVVSPANSFGFMDGGVDLVYARYFGPEIARRLRQRLDLEFNGELPVGHAVVIPTDHLRIPWMVSAPTMRIPGPIEKTVNVYLAFRAALLAVREHNAVGGRPIVRLLSPPLGTGVGAVPHARAARQMYAAYRDIVKGDATWRRSMHSIRGHHHALLW